MSNSEPRPHRTVTIEQLYPDLTPEEQQEAAYWLGRYLAVTQRIFERLQRERTQNLTDPNHTATI